MTYNENYEEYGIPDNLSIRIVQWRSVGTGWAWASLVMRYALTVMFGLIILSAGYLSKGTEWMDLRLKPDAPSVFDSEDVMGAFDGLD